MPVRHSLTAAVLAAAALASTGLAAGPADGSGPGDGGDEIIVCARLQDWTVPGTTITVYAPAERFCVRTGELPGPLEDA